MRIPGFFEYLLNRQSAVSHDIQLASFHLVQVGFSTDGDLLLGGSTLALTLTPFPMVFYRPWLSRPTMSWTHHSA